MRKKIKKPSNKSKQKNMKIHKKLKKKHLIFLYILCSAHLNTLAAVVDYYGHRNDHFILVFYHFFR